VIDENRKAKDLFHKRGFQIGYMEAEGTHNWNFWKKHIPETLAKQADFLHKQ
jgi:enterochelin esterase-like enzyme